MEEKIIEIYYDHYKNTFDNIKIYIQRRNYFTIIILCLAIVLSFQISNPEKTIEISNQLLKKNIGKVLIDFKYITSVFLFAMLWVVMMYYQIIFVIEKHYTYIHEIEDKLSEKTKPFEICREGKSYLNHYPWLSNVVDKIYTILFPVFLIIIAIVKWFSEYEIFNKEFNNLNFWIDSVFLLGIILTSLLYLSYRHFNDFKKKSPITNES